jgi:hypothetical protein
LYGDAWARVPAMLAAHQRSLVVSSPLGWRPIKMLRGRADVYRIIYDGGPGIHPYHETRRKLADLSLATSRSPCLYVCGPSSRHCTRGRLNWLIDQGDPPLRLSQRTARASTRLATRMPKTPPPEPKQKPSSSERRSRSHQTNDGVSALHTHASCC